MICFAFGFFDALARICMMVGSVLESMDISLEDNLSKISDSVRSSLSSFPCVQVVETCVLSGAWV